MIALQRIHPIPHVVLPMRNGEAMAFHQVHVARCGECSVDPRHPTARACPAANCPIRHVACLDHGERIAR